MYELFATIVLFSSLFGMGIILFRKIPILVNLAENEESKRSLAQKPPFLLTSRNSLEKFILKIESKTDHLLKSTTEKLKNNKNNPALTRRGRFSDGYWQKIKKVKIQKETSSKK